MCEIFSLYFSCFTPEHDSFSIVNNKNNWAITYIWLLFEKSELGIRKNKTKPHRKPWERVASKRTVRNRNSLKENILFVQNYIYNYGIHQSPFTGFSRFKWIRFQIDGKQRKKRKKKKHFVFLVYFYHLLRHPYRFQFQQSVLCAK